MLKNPLATAGEVRDMGLIPGSSRSPGEGHGNPLQDSCLENPMDKGAWQAAVHGVAQNRTQLKRLSMHQHMGEVRLPQKEGPGREVSGVLLVV